MAALTRNQTKTFFRNHVGVADNSVIEALSHEGIDELEDLVDFDDNAIKMVAGNMRKPVGDMEDPDNPVDCILITPKHLGAKAVLRLQAAAKLFTFYEDIGRDLTVANVTWKVIKAFKIENDAFKRRAKDDDEPDVPKISKSLPILKWTVLFEDFLHRVLGVRHIPLAHVIYIQITPGAIGVQQAYKPFYEAAESVEAELIERASHNHALYRDDNAKVYHHIEEASRGTVYAASIQPFLGRKYGRGALFAISNQFTGINK